jgi:hypothetical protein
MFESLQIHLITRLNELDFIDIEEVDGLIAFKSPRKCRDEILTLL